MIGLKWFYQRISLIICKLYSFFCSKLSVVVVAIIQSLIEIHTESQLQLIAMYLQQAGSQLWDQPQQAI